MYRFIHRYKQRLANLHLLDKTVLLKVYVDDCNQAGARLPYGTQYAGGKLYLPGEGWRGRSPPGQKLSAEQKEQVETDAEEMFARERTTGEEDKHTEIGEEVKENVDQKESRDHEEKKVMWVPLAVEV